MPFTQADGGREHVQGAECTSSLALVLEVWILTFCESSLENALSFLKFGFSLFVKASWQIPVLKVWMLNFHFWQKLSGKLLFWKSFLWKPCGKGLFWKSGVTSQFSKQPSKKEDWVFWVTFQIHLIVVLLCCVACSACCFLSKASQRALPENRLYTCYTCAYIVTLGYLHLLPRTCTCILARANFHLHIWTCIIALVIVRGDEASENHLWNSQEIWQVKVTCESHGIFANETH